MSVTATAVESPGPKYVLTSDIAQFCLPAANRDTNRRFAYANSICFAFLVVGIIGIVKVPVVAERALPDVTDVVPIEFTPPPEELQPPPTDQPPDPDQPKDVPTDAPVVAQVVAINSAEVAFPVQVEGPVILAPAKFAGPPPADLKAPAPPAPKPPAPTHFNWGGAKEGSFPKPSYFPGSLPSGTHVLTLLIWVNEEGLTEKLEIEKSSGSIELDRKTLQHIRNRWRWKPGEKRYYRSDIEFGVN